jgi:ectoine hydroxylase-related dioxygenase (phytanoyl-CoA dioxygenase family)
VPHTSWHLDIPGRGDPDQPHQVRLFGYVTDVVPWGGGTLVVEGSHELVRRMVAADPKGDIGSSAVVRRRLRQRHPWFDDLFRPSEHPAPRIQRFMRDGDEVDGVRVRVVELTGDAGDVTVMLPWTLHSASTNTAARPRFMVTHTLHR